MRLIVLISTIILISSYAVLADTKDCNQYDKISKKYAKCIKDKTTSKFDENKKKIKIINLFFKSSIFIYKMVYKNYNKHSQ